MVGESPGARPHGHQENAWVTLSHSQLYFSVACRRYRFADTTGDAVWPSSLAHIGVPIRQAVARHSNKFLRVPLIFPARPVVADSSRRMPQLNRGHHQHHTGVAEITIGDEDHAGVGVVAE